MKAQHSAAYISRNQEFWARLSIFNKPTFLVTLLHDLMWKTHIILVLSLTRIPTIMSPCKKQATKHADIFVFSLFVAGPICKSSAPTTQSTEGPFVCNNRTENLHPLQKNKFWKPHAMLEVMVCCVFGGGMQVKIILGWCIFYFFGGVAKIMPVLFQYTT